MPNEPPKWLLASLSGKCTKELSCLFHSLCLTIENKRSVWLARERLGIYLQCVSLSKLNPNEFCIVINWCYTKSRQKAQILDIHIFCLIIWNEYDFSVMLSRICIFWVDVLSFLSAIVCLWVRTEHKVFLGRKTFSIQPLRKKKKKGPWSLKKKKKSPHCRDVIHSS